jgi:hypothetical protein
MFLSRNLIDNCLNSVIRIYIKSDCRARSRNLNSNWDTCIIYSNQSISPNTRLLDSFIHVSKSNSSYFKHKTICSNAFFLFNSISNCADLIIWVNLDGNSLS